MNAWGLHGLVGGAGLVGNSYGVYGEVYATGAATNSYGVYGWARQGGNRYSVYGRVPNVVSGSAGWAGFFTGDISVNGITVPCDESLKTNIQELTNGSELLMQLHPKSYEYRHDEYPQMGLPNGVRFGFLSPDVQAVLPQLTKAVHQPEELDSLGNEIYPAVDYLGMSPLDIIPIVVAAVQDDHQQLADAQATIAALNDQLQQLTDRLDAMEQNVADCCAAHGALENGGEEIDEKSLNANDRYLRIAPNPFETQTTVFYQLEKNGRMQLLANSADGKQLQVLQEAEMEAGNYQYEWATGDLAPGVYYVTLLMDCKPVTKRAVKILR
ncbi:MAG: tail fiber domain-containing protein [Flavobacteriales bacterium]